MADRTARVYWHGQHYIEKRGSLVRKVQVRRKRCVIACDACETVHDVPERLARQVLRRVDNEPETYIETLRRQHLTCIHFAEIVSGEMVLTPEADIEHALALLSDNHQRAARSPMLAANMERAAK